MTWNSADNTIATVDTNGLVTAKAVATTSTTKVTATLDGKFDDVNVTVTPKVLRSITVTPANQTIAADATQQFTAMGTFSDATTQNLTNSVKWTSGNPAVAKIEEHTGLATAVAAGGTLTLFAANPGAWANRLRVVVTPSTADPKRFTLQVKEVKDDRETTLESFFNPLDRQDRSAVRRNGDRQRFAVYQLYRPSNR